MQPCTWTQAEKRVARAAYNAAWSRECAAVRDEVLAILDRSPEPSGVWRVHDYLSAKRREVDQKYDYRYSVLIRVLGQLLAERWIREAEIDGLDGEKVEQIRATASAWNALSDDEPPAARRGAGRPR